MRMGNWQIVLILFVGGAVHAQHGTNFSDSLTSGGAGPLMVTIEPGHFRMGCVSGFRCKDNRPVHVVSIERPFSLSVHEITRGQFRTFVQRSGYRTDAERGNQREGIFGGVRGSLGGVGMPRHSRGCVGFSLAEAQATGYYNLPPRPQTWLQPGFPQSDDHPVVCITWSDASAYVRWLALETGHRTGPTGCLPRPSGNMPPRAGTVKDDVDVSSFCRESRREPVECVGFPYTVAVGQGEPNAFGFYHMARNAFEWVEDCWVPTFQAAPSDGSARTVGNCGQRVVRGHAWDRVYVSHEIWSTAQDVHSTDNLIGIRVAQSHAE